MDNSNWVKSALNNFIGEYCSDDGSLNELLSNLEQQDTGFDLLSDASPIQDNSFNVSREQQDQEQLSLLNSAGNVPVEEESDFRVQTQVLFEQQTQEQIPNVRSTEHMELTDANLVEIIQDLSGDFTDFPEIITAPVQDEQQSSPIQNPAVAGPSSSVPYWNTERPEGALVQATVDGMSLEPATMDNASPNYCYYFDTATQQFLPTQQFLYPEENSAAHFANIVQVCTTGSENQYSAAYSALESATTDNPLPTYYYRFGLQTQQLVPTPLSSEENFNTHQHPAAQVLDAANTVQTWSTPVVEYSPQQMIVSQLANNIITSPASSQSLDFQNMTTSQQSYVPSSSTKRKRRNNNINYGTNIFCSVCNKEFGCKGSLEQHIRARHSKLRVFRCPICGKRFVTEEMLADHIQKHSAASKRFECPDPHCSNSYVHKQDRDQHYILHHGVPPQRCRICGKGFIRRDQLLRHEQAHEKQNALTLKRGRRKADEE